MARRQVIRTTKYKLSELKFDNEEQKTELVHAVAEYERYKATMVEMQRKLANAVADYDIGRAMATKSVVSLLNQVGDVIPAAKVEPQWWVYRDKSGEIIFESAFTEKDYRNATRAQKAGLSREVQSEDGKDLFEQDEDDQDEHSDEKIGF